MDDQYFVFATAGIILVYFLVNVVVRKFDPFAPVWLFLLGYVQVYIIQAVSYHEWALRVRGQELVAAANFRALWALVWFLTVYHLGIGPRLAPVLPRPPRGWSTPLIAAILSPPHSLGTLLCWRDDQRGITGGGVDLAGGSTASLVPLRDDGRRHHADRDGSDPVRVPASLSPGGIDGRGALHRHLDVQRQALARADRGAFHRLCVLHHAAETALLAGFDGYACVPDALVVGIAIGWRNNDDYELSFTGFTQYLSEFKIAKVLESLNIEEQEDPLESKSHETTEYGGFLLMMDTVPEKSEYDYGTNYLRIVSTYIPRIVWPTKPVFGRAQWVSAWIAGSELDRDEEFTGPAIGILGATQLNGGAVATLLVLAFAALLLRTAYEYFRLHADVPWVQFWWAITFFNAWFMVVGDDPLTWFYYNWGFSGFPIVVLLWWIHKSRAPAPQGLEEGASEATLHWA